MKKSRQIARILFQFDKKYDGGNNKYLRDALSAVLLMPDGSLWLAADETVTIERLSPLKCHNFGNHQQFALKDFLKDFCPTDKEGEISEVDIEGIAYWEPYLWLIGSHSTKRKKPKNDKVDILIDEEELTRLEKIKSETNRYLLARIPVVRDEQGEYTLKQSVPESGLSAAYLERTKDDEGQVSNLLIDCLKKDPHFGSILSISLKNNKTVAFPGKDNGFDIEGLVVQGNRIFIGLRGPVLRGWATILEIEVEEASEGFLKLKEIGKDGQLYQKYFLNLDGLGIRDLCFCNKDLLILAGPTMDLDGTVKLFRLNGGIERLHTPSKQKDKALEVLLEIPVGDGNDRPEGITLFPSPDSSDALLVVYDSPAPNRAKKDEPHIVWADVFELP